MSLYHLRHYMGKPTPNYTHERLLGQGGMGKVYLATDNQLQRHVAIKELTYHAQDEKVNHALKEARLLARVNHTNIIQIYNIHEEKSHISLVMEYFNSKTLSQFQNESYPTLIQKLDLLVQLSSGLAQAHKNGVIHCDLKPSNILVNAQGQLKITDFGIARLIPNNPQDTAPITPTNKPLESFVSTQHGCLFYMSPEQIKQQHVDYRSDIFSLGIIAYQLVVGSHPFGNSSDSDVATKICKHSPEHAKNLMIDTPHALTNLLMEMLVKPVEQRTLTASEIENRLKHIKIALMKTDISEQPTLSLSHQEADIGVNQGVNAQPKKTKAYKLISSVVSLCLVVLVSLWFYNKQKPPTKQVVILKPVLINSPLMSPMQQDLVMSAIEDALRQSVINTQNMYLVPQREVNAITQTYPDDLNKLKQAVGASDIISTLLECDNTRCKVNFARLEANPSNEGALKVKSEKGWLVPIDKFNAIYSASQTQFASLYPELTEVNQAGLVQRPINEEDYRHYLTLYSQIKGRGKYSAENLTELEELLTRSPYLYAAYSLYRGSALNLYRDSQDKIYIAQAERLLKSAPPEYRYSIYEAIDRFWIAMSIGDLHILKEQIAEAKNRGASNFILAELNAILFFSKSQYTDAAEAFKEALALRPSTVLLYNLAFTYWRMSELEMSENTLNKLFKVLPDEYQARQLQANIWLFQGKLIKVINAYKQIVKSSDNSQNLTNLSLAYGLNKQYAKSLKYAQLAVNKNKKHPFNLLNLADIEMIIGNEESAKYHYNQVISTLMDINEVKHLTSLAQAYAHLNQDDLAIDTLNKAQALASDNGEVSYASALIYSLLKEQASAVYHVQKALDNKLGADWFNLPWFDDLCSNSNFQKLMVRSGNLTRCQR